jgi:phage-related protein
VRDQSQQKEVYWIGSARGDLRRFPEEVRYAVGYALYVAQTGGKHDRAKPLRGFGDAGVVEIVEEHDGNTYRAVYTVRFREVIYVLHAFQKKSRKGIAPPKPDIDIVKERLKTAAEHYAAFMQRSRG